MGLFAAEDPRKRRTAVHGGRGANVAGLAWLNQSGLASTLHVYTRTEDRLADVAQLVEHHLAKVGVAGSNPVVRSDRPAGWPSG